MTNSGSGKHQSVATALTCALVLCGCADRAGRSDASDAVNAGDSSAAAQTDKWLGQWNGPEGTFLRIEGGNGGYEITIQDLDGPRTYRGTAAGARIHFDRNGAQESIRATTGLDTGMKWLRDKSDCLTIRTGEGYCRD